MKSMPLISILAIIACHMASACPPPMELVSTIEVCVEKMKMFVDALGEDQKSKCPMVKEGMDCLDQMLEECKHNKALEGQYDILKEKITENREDFAMYCGSMVTTSNIVLTAALCFFTIWIRTLKI